jgi:hypothetical protein
MNYNLLDLETVLRSIGRGIVCYAHDGDDVTVGDPIVWDGASPLYLAQLGDTEGDIAFNPQGSVATLTLPEISGGAIHEATYTGEDPMLEIPLFLADPTLLPIVSPTGLAGSGHFRVRDTEKRTLVVFPERLFRDTDESYKTLAFSGGAWTLNGVALDAEHLVLLNRTLWCWRVYFDRAATSFLGGHGDDGKNIVTCTAHFTMHPDLPDGHRLFTIGDPADFSINIEGGS